MQKGWMGSFKSKVIIFVKKTNEIKRQGHCHGVSWWVQFLNINNFRTNEIECRSHGCNDENEIYHGGKCLELGTQAHCDVRNSILSVMSMWIDITLVTLCRQDCQSWLMNMAYQHVIVLIVLWDTRRKTRRACALMDWSTQRMRCIH